MHEEGGLIGEQDAVLMVIDIEEKLYRAI